MKVIIGDRSLIYSIASASFASCDIRPHIAEVGVLRGENAQTMIDILSPASCHLIDAWSIDAFKDYHRNNSHRPWVSDITNFSWYFGGPLDKQSTFDNLYQEVVTKFASNPQIKIVRANSLDAINILKQQSVQPPAFDLLYLDASHQYETVLDDLLLYQEFVSPDGVIQMNDCCHSNEGVIQNLGVLEATAKFLKMSDFIPVLVTHTNFTDVLLARRNSKLVNVIDKIVNVNDITYVELPPQLLGALKIRPGRKFNLSFC